MGRWVQAAMLLKGGPTTLMYSSLSACSVSLRVDAPME
jgi:hypothetical protein